MTGFALSPQGKAAAALEKKKMRRTPMFAVGAKGAGVGDLQEFLKRGGYYQGEIDNDFGGQTKAAVEAYQRDKGLTADGMVGTNTMDAINADMAGGSPAAAPAAPAAPAADEEPGSVTVTRFAEDGVTPEETVNVVTSTSKYFPTLMAANLPPTVINQMYAAGMLEGGARDMLLGGTKGKEPAKDSFKMPAAATAASPKPEAMKKKTPAAASRPVAQPGAAAPVATSTPATAASTVSGQRKPTPSEVKMMDTAARQAVISSGLMTAAEMAAAITAGNT